MTIIENKILRITAIVFILLGALVVLGFLFFPLNRLVERFLVRQVFLQTSGAYQLQMADLDIDVFNGDVVASEVKLIPDSLKIYRHTGISELYVVETPEINLKALDLWKLFLHKEIDISSLNILRPKISWIRNLTGNSGKETGDENTQEKDSSPIPPAHIGEIIIKEATLNVFNRESGSAQSVSADKVSLRIEKFVFYSFETSKIADRVAFDDLTFLLKDYTMKLPDSLYTFHVDSLKASYKSSVILVNGFNLTPRYDESAFAEINGFQTDRIQLSGKEMRIEGIDLDRLKNREEFIASHFQFDSLKIYVYRDKRFPQENQIVKLPQQQLREANFLIKLDSLSVNNTDITYSERIAEAASPGNINFINLSAKIKNITNDPISLRNGEAITGDAVSYLMGIGKISAKFRLPIADEDNNHSFEGALTPMDLSLLNPMLKFAALAEIKSGNVNSLMFSAQANDTYAFGNLNFGYDNLKILLLKNGKDGKEKGLLSFLANTFVVKSANPLNDKFRAGEMNFKRDKTKSILNYWWKTVLSGLKDVIGIPEQKKS